MIRQLSVLTSHFKMTTKPLLVGFDFDYTIVNQNTDQVACEMLPEPFPYKSGSEWTAYMRRVFELLHEHGIAEDQIRSEISNIRSTPGFHELLKNLHASNCEIIIISDANTVFIDTWLKHNKLDHVITKIFTNAGWFDEAGMLHIKEFHQQDWCKLSAKNMCKGYILENYIKTRSQEGVTFGKVIYAGDGSNDFCAMAKLSENDIAFPRDQYPILKLLESPEGNIVKAETIPWRSGTDILEALKQNNIFSTKL